jgi:sulfur carrier protein
MHRPSAREETISDSLIVLLIMDIQVNQVPLTLPEQSTLAEALSLFGARPPFAVAVNGEFVARGQHAVRTLQAGDKIDVVQPVAGG